MGKGWKERRGAKVNVGGNSEAVTASTITTVAAVVAVSASTIRL